MKVLIRQNMFSDSVDFLFYEDRDGKRYVAKPIKLNLKETKIGEEIEPTITLPSLTAQEFLKSLAEDLDKKGIKTENDFKMQGLLEAKDNHLQDMRKLVFNKEAK